MAGSPHQGGESRFPSSLAADQPLYLRISNTLRRQIASGDFRPGDLLPSEAQLMAEFRVSRHTVRAALAHLERDGLITRVKGRGSVVNFVPPLANEPQSARAARKGSDTIAFCAAEEDPFTMSILWGIELEASRYHVSVLFASSRGDMTKQQELLASFAESGLLGVIVMPVDVPPALMRESALSLDRWADAGLRLVSVDRYYPGSRVPTVTSDNFDGAYQAVSHLLQIGRQRIIAVSLDNTNTSSVAARLEGYRWAFKDAGLLANPEWEYTRFARDDNDFLAFVDRIRPDGLFALNDNIAMRCMQLLRAAGRTIPDDVAVVGFDDVPAAALLDVPLTTVRQDGQQMGVEAARLLLEENPAGSGQTTPVRVKIPVQLIVRASTVGAAATAEPTSGQHTSLKG
ncbi:MAG: GntR family transcriptional regulator [Limnochordales bacterium]|nr:GntR family transcriptional regulator [Limnochordales bacterium]